jgi:hypothetical protein
VPQIYTNPPKRRQGFLPVVGIVAALVIAGAIGHQWVAAGLSYLNFHYVEFRAGNLDSAHSYAAESQLLTTYIQSAPPVPDQVRAQLQLARIGTADHQPKQAYQGYLQAYDLEGAHPTVALTADVASAAAASGNKATAVAFYYQAINMRGTSSTEADAYRAKIAKLESP